MNGRLVFRSACGVLLLGSLPAAAAVKPGLEGAQDLFRRNRWEEARAHLRRQWASLSAKDQPAATFLVGRSYVREAEFYRAVRRVGVEVGLAYLKELAAQRANRRLALVPLFTAFYELEAEQSAAAERDLLAMVRLPSLPVEWQATARLRHAVALQRLGRSQEAATVLAQPSVEGRFWRMLLSGVADASPVGASARRDRVLGAALMFRGGRAVAAEPLLSGLELDLPDATSQADRSKELRFHDPLLSAAWERICWERAVLALRPLAVAGTGVEKALASCYVGLSLFQLGARDEAARFLKEASASAPAALLPSSQVLLAACAWQDRLPSAAELGVLWDATQAQPDAVLVWDELVRPDRAGREPFASRLDVRLKSLLQGGSERPSGALVGRWGLARLRRGDDPGPLVAALSEQRDDSNKNKIDWNDPLLLLALAAANYRNQQYAQSLETLFELSKSFPGLRWLQWNLQGVYAARQKAGGEARISQ